MTDPFALLPLAVAAGGGRIDGHAVSAMVAAGVTLLQRCAPLVRAMATGRSALLLPPGPEFFTALAASDGRGALLLDPSGAGEELMQQLTDARVRAVFTLARLTTALRRGGGEPLAIVLLDEAPARATVLTADRSIAVDLGSHRGLMLEGDQQAAGLDEECLVTVSVAADGVRRIESHTHRSLLADSRGAAGRPDPSFPRELAAAASWSDLGSFTTACAALLRGADLRTRAPV